MCISDIGASLERSSQGVYNQLLLVPIVGGACFQRHQLAAVLMHHLASFR